MEQFENKYYQAILEKKQKIKEKKDLKDEERVNQSKGRKGPTSGFYTSKAAKNPALFESSLFNLIALPNVDVKHFNNYRTSKELESFKANNLKLAATALKV